MDKMSGTASEMFETMDMLKMAEKRVATAKPSDWITLKELWKLIRSPQKGRKK